MKERKIFGEPKYLSSFCSSQLMATTFNMIIVGDRRVGKTSLLRRITTSDWKAQYNATLTPVEYKCNFYTTAGPVTINLWDCPDIKSLPKDISISSAIIMFDVTSPSSYSNVTSYYEAIHHHYGNTTPILLLGNKVDLKERKITPRMINIHQKLNMAYYDYSSKSNYNFEKPFLYGIREYLRDPTVRFSVGPPPPL